MRSTKVFLITILLWCIVSSVSSITLDGQVEIEPRGKKKKIALFVYFADIVLKKIFVLKLIYAFVLWIVIHKAGYFLGWFVSFLKEKKQEYHSHDHDHDHVPHHYDHGPGYGSVYNYGPYRRKAHGLQQS